MPYRYVMPTGPHTAMIVTEATGAGRRMAFVEYTSTEHTPYPYAVTIRDPDRPDLMDHDVLFRLMGNHRTFTDAVDHMVEAYRIAWPDDEVTTAILGEGSGIHPMLATYLVANENLQSAIARSRVDPGDVALRAAVEVAGDLVGGATLAINAALDGREPTPYVNHGPAVLRDR